MGCLIPHVLAQPYELDHHYALDALIEFCAKRDWVWQVNNHTRKFEAWIFGTDLYLGRSDNSLALAICEAIAKAAGEGGVGIG